MMPTYVLLTRLSPEALTTPDAVERLNRQVEDRVRRQCPDVKWLANYALLGPYDYLDIYDAPDAEVANKVALLVRSLGHATTETWAATTWDRFLAQAESLKA
jgi:uncharacterized protein with GYD domain